MRARALAVATLVAAAGACARPPLRVHHVAMRDFVFAPASLVVARGDTVAWSNADVVPHTATASDSAWDSRSVPADGTWRWVAARPGRHAYVCVFHPTMRGTIEVR